MRVVLGVLVLVALVAADDPTCALTCYSDGGGPGLHYEAGKQYKFKYMGQVLSSTMVNGPDEAQMVIAADVIISANTPCDLKLQVMMENVEAADNQYDEAKWFRDALQEYDLHFSYQSGVVEQLCPHQDEDPVVTNFKRGILSALQVSIPDLTAGNEIVLDEEDVSGWCETRYMVTSDTQITKTKEGCHASGYLPYIPHTHYHTRPSHQTPLFRSHRSCEVQHIDGELEQVECTEEIQVSTSLASYFSSSSSSPLSALASITTISMLKKQSVEYQTGEEFTKDGQAWRRAPLSADLKGAAESAKKRRPEEENVKAQIDETLESLTESLDINNGMGMEEQRPHLFSRLVHLLGLLEEDDDLEDIWITHSKNKDYRSFLLDALMLCEGIQCVRLLKVLTVEQQISSTDSMLSQDQIRSWLMALHFHHNPHPDSVRAIMELGDNVVTLSGKTIMAASTMVNKICYNDPDQCHNASEPFLAHVREKVEEWCEGVDGQYPTATEVIHHDNFIQVLRALGNAGVQPDLARPESCYGNSALKPEVRVTALQSYRRVGCPVSHAPWKILEDRAEAGDVRVAAYQALIPCAPTTPDFFTRLKHLMEHEEDTQVGSYIWSHVNNLIEHPGPSEYEQEMSQLARQYLLPLRFSAATEDFRTSRNHRYSQFSQLLNVGGSVDASMIFTPASFLPRRVSANVTFDLLDISFNALEVGGEFSGLENLLEKFFGKDGYFGNEKLLNLVRPEGEEPSRTDSEESPRVERNIIRDDKIQEFQKLYDEGRARSKTPGGEEEETKGSFYLRVFGNEVIYIENIFQLSPGNLLNHLFNALSTSRSFQVVDQEYVRATQLGFPMHLKLNATGSLVFKHDFKINPTENEELFIEGSVAPSLVISADETLWVDGYVSASGVRRMSMYSGRTELGGMLTLGRVVEAQINVPGPEVTKISSTVKVATYDNSRKTWRQQEDPRPEDTTEYCTPESFNQALGLKVCGSVGHGTYEWDGEMVAREPYKTDLVITKTDSFNHYRLYVQKHDNVLEALFDTPGSTTDRKIQFLFNLRPNNEGGYVVVRGIGYGVEGQFENTEDLKKLTLEYRHASKVIRKLEVSLEKEVDGIETHLTPSLEVTLGPDTFRLDGKLSYSVEDQDEEGLQASLEMDGTWQKVAGGRVATQAFGLATGSFVANQEQARLHATTEYGIDRTDTHSVTTTLDFSKGKGSAVLKASQVNTSVKVDFEYHPGHIQASSNVSYQDTQVTSQIILKNLAEGDSRDYHIKASLESEQLDLNYIGELLYKVTDSAFQAEAEVKLDTTLHHRLLLTYLWEELHHLVGIHLTLNDFVAEIGHDIDLSQPQHTLVTLTGMAGGMAGGLHLTADYSHEQPLNASLDIYGSQGDDLVVGASLSVASDPEWANFTGRSNLKWFDWSHTLQQNLILEDAKVMFKIGTEGGRNIQIMSEISPAQIFDLSVWAGPEEDNPEFQVGIEHSASNVDRTFNVNMTAGTDVLLHFGFALESLSGNKFSSTLRLLESEVVVTGQYDSPGSYYSAFSSSFNGSAEATVTLPSGRSLTSDFTLSHILEGNQHTLVATSSQNGDVVEGRLMYITSAGWLKEDLTSLNLTVTTPFDQLAKFGVAFRKSGDPMELNFAEIFLDDIKVRGELQLGDPRNVILGLEYRADDQCSTRVYVHYQEHDDHHYTSCAGIALTDQHLWEAAINTTFGRPNIPNALSSTLKIQAPVLPAPIHLKAAYNLTRDLFGVKLVAGAGEAEILALVSGQQEWSWQRHMLHALGEFKTPWTDPLTLNATYDHTQDTLGINLDFQSSMEHVSSWVAEFGSNFASPQDTKAHFVLTHSDLQITADFFQNQTDNSLKQQLDCKINGFTVTYNVDIEWDPYSLGKVKGVVSLFNLFDHNLDLTLTHVKKMDSFVTMAAGSLDDHNFKIDNMLNFNDFDKWSYSLQIELIGDVADTKAEISLKSEFDFPSLNSTLDFSSHWTEDYSETFTVQVINSTTYIKTESIYGDSTLFSSILTSTGSLNLEKSDLELLLSSSFFDDLSAKWKHDIDPGHLVLGEVTYGDEFHAHIGSELKLENTWLNEFSYYDLTALINITSLGLHSKVSVSANANISGEVELRWNDYYLRTTSTLFEDGAVEMVMSDAMTEYQAEFKYEADEQKLCLIFTVTYNGESIVTLKTMAESLYPMLEVLSTLELHRETNNSTQKGQLKVTADFSKLNETTFKSSANMESNLWGLEGLGGQMNLNLKVVGRLWWAGDLNGQLDIEDQSYSVGLNCSLEVGSELEFEFGAKYESNQSNQTETLKELSLIGTLTDKYEILGKATVVLDHASPPWSLGFTYSGRSKNFKGFVMPGNGKKFELSCHFSSRTITIDAQMINEDGSEFQLLKGNITWIFRRAKQLLTLYMTSDYLAIAKMSGQVIIQRKNDLAVKGKLKVNDQSFSGNLRLLPTKSGHRFELRIDNKIINPFKINIILDLSLRRQSIKFDFTVDLNDEKGWLTGNFKFSLPESYLKLKTHFAGFESFSLIITTVMDKVYGASVDIQAPQFSFNVIGEVHKQLVHVKISTSLLMNYTGDPLLDFSLYLGSNTITIFCSLMIPELTDPFKLNITGNLMLDNVSIQAESDINADLSLGLSVTGQWKEGQSLRIRYYNPASNSTTFLFRNSISLTKTELAVELPGINQTLTFDIDYNVNEQPVMINGSLYNSILDYNLNANLVIAADINNDIGEIEMTFTTDTVFNYTKLYLSYDVQSELFKEGSFKIKTPNGDADGDFRMHEDDTHYSIKADMTSELHTFKVYSFELVKEIDGLEEKYTVKTAQDDIELNFSGVKKLMDGKLELIGSLTTTIPKYPEYEKFDFQWIHPTTDLSEVDYEGKLTALLFGQVLMLEGKHNPSEDLYEVMVSKNVSESDETYAAKIVYQNYHSDYRKQSIKMFFTLPHFETEDVSIVLTYDLDNNTATLIFDSPRGAVGMAWTWNYARERYVGASLTSYLSFFDLGKYTLDLAIPLQLSENGNLTLSGYHPKQNFVSQLLIRENLSKVNFSLIVNSTSNPVERTYSFSYIYGDSLTLEVQFDKWYALTKWTLTGRQIPVASGSFEVKSNLPGYEKVEGSWGLGERNMVYYGQVRIDVQGWGVVSASCQLDMQNSPSNRPWEKVKFNAQFESPFTPTHHLHVEYDLEALTLALYYQQGPDTFQVQWNASFGRRSANFLLIGNVPIKGVSTFSINFNSNFVQSYSMSFEAIVEDSAIKSSFELTPDWMVGSVKFALTSPFIRPANAVLDWSFSQSPLQFRAIISAGDYSGKVKTTIEYTRNSADFEYLMSTVFEEKSSFNVIFSYKLSDNSFEGTLVANANNNFLKMKSTMLISEENLLLKFTGILEVFGVGGSLEMDISKTDKIYKGSISGELPRYKRFHITFLIDSYQLKGSIKHHAREVLCVSLTRYLTKIEFKLTEYWAFTLELQSQYEPKKYRFNLFFTGFDWQPVILKLTYFRGQRQQLNLSLDSPFMPPFSLHIIYAAAANHKFTAQLKLGENSYEVTGRAKLRWRRSSLNMQFDFSQDADNPVRLAAEYNIRDFVVSQMRVPKPLGSVVLDWGQRIEVNVTGLNKGKRLKLDATITTPYKDLQILLMGYDGTLNLENSLVDFACTAYVNGSREVVLSGHTKLSGSQIDLNWALQTTFPGLQKLVTSLVLTPDHAVVGLQYNDEGWKAECEYELSPSFSVMCSIETPIIGYEKITLSVSAEPEDDKFSGQFIMTWPAAQHLELSIDVEKWKAEIKLQTPWEPFQSCSLKISLTTESERLMFSSDLKWDAREVETSLSLDPYGFEFMTEYQVEREKVSQVKVEGAMKDEGVKALVELITPFSSLKSMKVTLKAQHQGFEVILVVNDVENILEGKYSGQMGEFKASLPLFGDLKWTIEAENNWLKLDTEITLILPHVATPVTGSLNYAKDPDSLLFEVLLQISMENTKLFSFDADFTEEAAISVSILENHMKIRLINPDINDYTLTFRLETEQYYLQKLSASINVKVDIALDLVDMTLRISSKVQNEKSIHHKLHLTAFTENLLLTLNVELEGDLIALPYTLHLLAPLNLITNDYAELRLELKQDDNELFVLTYMIDFDNRDWLVRQILTVKLQDITAKLHITLGTDILSAEILYPEPETSHTFVIFWSEDHHLGKFMFGAKLNSPYLKETPVEFKVDFSRDEEYQGAFRLSYSHGIKELKAHIFFHYDRWQQEVQGSFVIDSDWHGTYSLEADVQWKNEIKLTITLNNLDEEHKVSVYLNLVDYTLEMSLISPRLPMGEVYFTSKINSDFDISNMYLGSKLQAGERELSVEAKFESDYEYFSSLDIIIQQDDMQALTASLLLSRNETTLRSELHIFSDFFPELVSDAMFHYERLEQGRIIFADVSNSHLLGATDISLRVISGGYSLLDQKKLTFILPNYEFSAEVDMNKHFAELKIGSPCHEIHLLISHEAFNQNFIFDLKTTFAEIEVIQLKVKWPLGGDKSIRFVHAFNGAVIDLNTRLDHDEFFGRYFEIRLTLPLVDALVLRSPRYIPGIYLGAMLEVLDYKLGGEVYLDYKSKFDSNFVICLYMPFEQYDIVSLQYIFLPGQKYKAEAQLGKIGFTVSFTELEKINGFEKEVVLRINERTINVVFKEASTMSKVLRYYLWVDNGSVYGFEYLSMDIQYRVCDGVAYRMYLNHELQLKLATAWGTSKSLEIQTPKISPGYLHVVYLSNDNENNYRAEVGIASEDTEPWHIYKFHIGERTLVEGLELFFFIDGFGSHLGMKGELLLDYYHCYNQILFELNENKLGYVTTFIVNPGLLSTDYIAQLQMFATNRTLVYYASAIHSFQYLKIYNRFTWNAMDSNMPPVVFKLSYYDHSIFGHQKHYLEAEFIHPDIMNIVMQGNITQPLNSPLHAVAELIDYNSTDRKIIMMVDAPLMTDEGEQQLKVNISQQSSGFDLSLDSRMRQMEADENTGKIQTEQNRVETDHNIRYWSLSRETWQEVNISTGVGASTNGYNFLTSLSNSESNWGYTWEGHILNQAASSSLGIKGTSRDLGDFWEFDTKVNKLVPEIQVSLLTGQQEDGIFEAGRVRVGLHSPVAAGAILEHQKFGQWKQDAAAGLVLTSSDVVQVFAIIDPTLHQGNHTSYIHLVSPAPQIWSSWVKDASAVANQVQEWSGMEIPAVVDALVVNETITAVWERVTSNWEYLLVDLEATATGITNDALDVWSSQLYPALLSVQNFIMSGCDMMVMTYNSLVAQLSDQVGQVLEFLSTSWSYLNDQIFSPVSLWFEEVTGGVAGQAWEMSMAFFIDLDGEVSTMLTESAAYIQTLMNSLVDGATLWVNQLSEKLIEYVDAANDVIQLYFETVLQALLSYKDDVSASLHDSCWQNLVEKFGNLTTVQQTVGDAVATLKEFLQPNEYLNRFNQVKEWSQGVWSTLEGLLSQLQQMAVQSWESVFKPMGDSFTGFYEELTGLAVQIEAEGLYSVMDQKAAEISAAVSGVYEQMLGSLEESAVAAYTYLTQQPLYIELQTALSGVTDWVMATWEKWTSGERKDLSPVERVLFPAADVIKMMVDHSSFLGRMDVFKPWTHGVVRYNLFLPFTWYSFLEHCDWQDLIRVFQESPVSEAEHLLATGSEEPLGLGRLLAFPYAFIPPLTATATISGQHLTTFDGHHHQFLGSCSYLLAKDFVGDDFEIVGVYQNGAEAGRGGVAGLEAVMIHGPRIYITLHMSGSVTNPVMQPGTRIYTTKSASVLVLPDLVVYCSNMTRSCVFSVSAKYFNRLGGLLGNYNHNPNDDSRGPGSEEDMHDPAELSRLWSVSPSPCYLANQANTVTKPREAPSEDVEVCLDLFLRSVSPLSPCFTLVDPRPYFRDCLGGRRHPARSSRHLQPPCHVASTYLTQCRARGLNLSPLKQCTSTGECMVGDMQVEQGWSQTYQQGERGYSAADVALVVETARCNQDQDMKTLLTPLTEHLARRNINDVRYAIVTVPGEGEGAGDMEGFMTSGEAVAHLTTLTYRGDMSPHTLNAVAIVSTARDLKWRPGVSRTIIHVTCSGCGVSDVGVDILGALKENDVTYHLMTDFEIVMAGTSKEAKARERKLLGFDEDLAYTVKDFRSFQGSDKVRLALREPDGVCVRAALASGGSVFTRDKWDIRRKIQIMKLLAVFGERVAISSSARECQECQCHGSGVLQCQRCFASPLFFIPRSYVGQEEMPERERGSIASEIKRNFQEEFVNNNEGFANIKNL